jgi:hypothetical protein
MHTNLRAKSKESKNERKTTKGKQLVIFVTKKYLPLAGKVV